MFKEKDNVKLNEIKDNFSKQSDSINNKMSELLLAGWTLTNNNCPFCIGVNIYLMLLHYLFQIVI